MLNDSLYEQIVDRRFGSRQFLARVLWILLIFAVALVGGLFLGFIGILIAVVVAMLILYLVFPKQNVEYEYDILDYEMEFHVIYSKSKQKKKLSIDLRKVEKILPKGSRGLQSVQAKKTYDFTSRENDSKVYAIIVMVDDEMACVYFEPDEEMKTRIRRWVRSYTGDFEI